MQKNARGEIKVENTFSSAQNQRLTVPYIPTDTQKLRYPFDPARYAGHEALLTCSSIALSKLKSKRLHTSSGT